jgi:NADH pyrophosphatase NudC (nudix superfamily)
MDRLDPFLPRDNNETLWVDLKKDQVLPFFQPMPVEDMGNLGDAFVNYDVTQKERLFGKQQEVVKYIKPVQGAITCEKCGSSWETKSTNWKVRCNSCGHRTPNPYYRGPMIQPIQNNTANPLAATSPIAPARGVAAPAQVCKE